jgi:hypothetical protein
MEPKIAGGTSEQRAEVAGAAAADLAAVEQAAAKQAHREMQAKERAIADAAAMAAVEKAEAERVRQAAQAAEAQERKAAVEADPSAEARRLLDEAEEIRKRAEDERARLEQLGNDYATRLQRERDRDRVAALRSMGAIAGVSDAQLLLISPDVDPETASGKAELDRWREDNAGLFHRPTAPRVPTAAEVLGTLRVKQSPNGHYGPEFFARILKRNLER